MYSLYFCVYSLPLIVYGQVLTSIFFLPLESFLIQVSFKDIVYTSSLSITQVVPTPNDPPYVSGNAVCIYKQSDIVINFNFFKYIPSIVNQIF